ncbi:MAG: helix-turn-helix transcriptional regulator [Clostridiales bacterium]|nr:helix-turn-helix transcriptional regulator [Clostridiales bacterium]
MNDIVDSYYKEEFAEKGFLPAQDNSSYCEIGSTWKLSSEIGEGTFWIYGQKNLFDIKIHDFFFYKDTMVEFDMPKCLGIMQYDSISGEELSPYRRLEAGSIKSFIGGYQPYKILLHKKIPIRSIGIEIMPAYYSDYLKKQYPGECTNPQEAFAAVGQTKKFPEMVRLLSQVKNYRGQGLSAKLFFEGKVAEAVSLIVEWRKSPTIKQELHRRLSSQDIYQIEMLTSFLNDHYAQDTSLKQLVKIACMGTTKLQTAFKKYHGCTITAYIQQRRMSQAEYLLANTDLTIGQIAESVGYSKASRFSELFRKSTGLLPGEFRKMAQR